MLTKIGVLVSGYGTNLQALIDRQKAGQLPHGEIAVVISNKKGAYALNRASENGIPAATVSKKHCGSQAAFESKISEIMEAHGVELIVLAGFLAILSADFVKKYSRRIINVHPSLIPSFCGEGYYGLHVHEEALKYGVKVTGATVHYVNEITDGGEIILQKAVYVQPGDTPETLQKRVMEQAEWQLLPQAVEMAAKEIYEEKNR